MTSTTTQSFDRSIEGTVENDTIRPQLFLVESGAYASNGVYGSGAAAVEPDTTNIEAVTLRGSTSPYTQSKCDIRQHDHEVSFSMSLTLDTTQTAPVVTDPNEELRIRTQPIVSSEPGRYLNMLPAHDTAYGQPMFESFEILTIDTTGAAAPVSPATLPVTQELRARLLHGGELALVSEIPAVGPNIALLWADLLALFGVPDTALRISIRGRYRAVSSRGGVAS